MITISPGHWKKGTGAVGFVDEVTEARRVVSFVVERLQHLGIGVQQVQDNTSASQSQNLQYLISAHNKTERMLDVSVHFNTTAGTHSRPIGTEVLYQDADIQGLAAHLSHSISSAAQLPNRGAKRRTDLAFLNKTNRNALLIEVCFVNSSADVSLYKQHFEAIGEAIADTLTNYVRPSTNPFSSPTLYKRAQKLYANKAHVKAVLDKGIAQGSFSVVWREAFERGALTFSDFCGLCVLLNEVRNKN